MVETTLKQLIIDDTWPEENPSGDGQDTPAPVYPSIIQPNPGDGDSEDIEPTGPDPINNHVEGKTSPDHNSK